MNAPEHVKQLGDFASIVTVAGTIMGYLPYIAALFTIIWTIIRIFETDTVRRWQGKEPIDRRKGE